MDRSAIEAMLEIGASNTKLYTDTHIPAVIIPKNNEIKPIEHLMESPHHFKAHFSTPVLSEFINYVNTQKQPSSAIYIGMDTMQSLAIFDQGTPDEPLWGYHKSSLTLLKSPAYTDLLEHNTHVLNQQSLIDFLTDWRINTQLYDGNGEEIEFQNAINRIRRLTVTKKGVNESEQSNYSANRSSMESVEITAAKQSLPASFTFTCSPYQGFDNIDFYCELRGLIDGNHVRIKYRIEALNAIIEKIANEFRDKIKQQLPESNIYIGIMTFR